MRLLPRLAAGQQATVALRRAIEPFARSAQNGCFRHQLGKKENRLKGGFLFWWTRWGSNP